MFVDLEIVAGAGWGRWVQRRWVKRVTYSAGRKMEVRSGSEAKREERVVGVMVERT